MTGDSRVIALLLTDILVLEQNIEGSTVNQAFCDTWEDCEIRNGNDARGAPN